MKLAFCLAVVASVNAQTLTVAGDIAKARTLTREDLAKMPRAQWT